MRKSFLYAVASRAGEVTIYRQLWKDGKQRMHLILLAVRLLLAGLFLIAGGQQATRWPRQFTQMAGGLWPRLFR